MSFVLASLQAGARGTQACINAHSAVQAIIGDLDTTIMFATAGTLNSENDKETFADYRCVMSSEANFFMPCRSGPLGFSSSYEPAGQICFGIH